MDSYLYRTTNFRVVTLFIALKIKEVSKERVSSDRSGPNTKVQFSYDTSDPEVREVLDKWKNGVPIMVDVRELFDAISEFHLRVQNTPVL